MEGGAAEGKYSLLVVDCESASRELPCLYGCCCWPCAGGIPDVESPRARLSEGECCCGVALGLAMAVEE